LFTIVQRRAIDFARARGRTVTTTMPITGELPDKDAPLPEEELNRRFQAEVVHDAIEAFRRSANEPSWRVFELCRLRGLNSAQAAEILEISPEATRKRLERATKEFRDAIAGLVGSSLSDFA
jgi:DNA-directed RNA polymerase specialized sigma24 family protein